ncbi:MULTISPECIES: DUF1214 domain-containing protein [Ruegeria]|uniref:DUF1214 domain-containing protein n=1 Tax=Ruegeria TaxID=97050 RepID=UPI001480F18E|nr:MULTISPECIES: DUF1214 domain-containing protein [Ruegeria]
MKLIRTLSTFLAIAMTIGQLSAQERDFERERFERRAYESALWAQPLVSGNQMIVGALDSGQKLNQVAYFSKPPNWKFQSPTPNNSTPYVNLIYDVKDGPVVVELPAATERYSIFGTFLDVWQRPVVDVGSDGDDKGEGGKYFIYAANTDAKVPEGYLPVPLKTYRGYGTLRIITPDLEPATLEGAEAYIRAGIQQYPYGSDERLPHMDIYDVLYSAQFPFDSSFFDRLQEIINHEEVREIDKYPLGMLSSLGIERGGAFDPTDGERAILDDVMARVHAELQNKLSVIPPLRWGNETQWTQPVANSMIQTMMTYEDENKVFIDDRAFTYYTYIAPPVKLGSATAYLMVTRDKFGEALEGDKSYRMTVPADVPVEQFWSILVYDVATASYIRGADPIGLASTESPTPKVNDDGSVDVYFGPEVLNEGVNYLPTTGAANYFLLFRFYGPTEAYRNDSWKLNDLEPM